MGSIIFHDTNHIPCFWTVIGMTLGLVVGGLISMAITSVTSPEPNQENYPEI